MRVAGIVFATALLILVLLNYPFTIKLKLHTNLIKGLAFYSIKVVFIKLLVGKLSTQDGDGIVIQNTHNKLYSSSTTDKQKLILQKIAERLKIARAEIYFSAGISTDAYATAILCGSAYSTLCSVVAVIISSNPLVNVFCDVDPSFYDDSLEVTASCLLQISILDIILGYLSAIKMYKKRSKNGTKK